MIVISLKRTHLSTKIQLHITDPVVACNFYPTNFAATTTLSVSFLVAIVSAHPIYIYIGITDMLFRKRVIWLLHDKKEHLHSILWHLQSLKVLNCTSGLVEKFFEPKFSCSKTKVEVIIRNVLFLRAADEVNTCVRTRMLCSIMYL